MMTRLTALTAAASALAAIAMPSVAKDRAFDPLTARYAPATGIICVKSGWGIATQQTGRLVRSGECRKAAGWKTRGIDFDLPRVTVASAELATR